MAQLFTSTRPLTLAVAVLGYLCNVFGAPVDLEADIGVGPGILMPRSNALSQRTVLLKVTQNVTIPVCLPDEDTLTAATVRFSSDGFVKEAAVLVDDNQIGSFLTANNSNHGENWNVFHTAQMGFEPMTLAAGEHSIVVALISDMDVYGLEIDTVSITLDSDLTLQDVLCNNGTEANSTTAATSDDTEEASSTPSTTTTAEA